MTKETATHLTPAEVLEQARAFFTGEEAVASASIEEESDRHIVFNTFRSRITVAAFPDPDAEAPTRVRASTLREDSTVAQFITYVRTAARSKGEALDG